MLKCERVGFCNSDHSSSGTTMLASLLRYLVEVGLTVGTNMCQTQMQLVNRRPRVGLRPHLLGAHVDVHDMHLQHVIIW